MPEGDEQGYFVYHQNLFIPVEFDFTHCFWYIVKYDNQRSCWASHKLPPTEYSLDILDSEVTDRSEWGPIDDGKDSSNKEEEEDTRSIGHPDSIDIKIPTQEEEKTERQLGKLAKHFPVLYRSRSHPASSRLPPITTIMATQVTTEPVQTLATEEGTSSVRKGGDPPGGVPDHSGLADQHSHIECQEEEVMEEVTGEVTEEVVEEGEDPQGQQETQMIETMAQS